MNSIKHISTKYGTGKIVETIDGNIKTISYLVNNVPHRDDGAAYLKYHIVDPQSANSWKKIVEEWYDKGILHRKDLPATTMLIDNATILSWVVNGETERYSEITKNINFEINTNICFKATDKPSFEIKAIENSDILYHLQIWANHVAVEDVSNSHSHHVIKTSINLSQPSCSLIIKTLQKSAIMYVKTILNKIIMIKPHRVNGPAIILDDFVNPECSIQIWRMKGKEIPLNLPRLDRNGKILGQTNKAQILDVILDFDREYGKVLNEAYNQTPTTDAFPKGTPTTTE
ncbi:MAG TPA: hypothetical protein VMX17_06790 [Candidatus Glassbacteria bacterium]|nr:hypothetical protein [Candidatus Glassbacteria bacterium]